MKRKLIVIVLTALLAGALSMPSASITPIVDGIYCKIKPSECAQQVATPTESEE